MAGSAKIGKDDLRLTNSGALSKDLGLRDQIQRASVSSMTNIAEGFDCESKLEFARFLGFARRSAVEVQSLLYAAFDINYINEAQLKEHYEQARKTWNLNTDANAPASLPFRSIPLLSCANGRSLLQVAQPPLP